MKTEQFAVDPGQLVIVSENPIRAASIKVYNYGDVIGFVHFFASSAASSPTLATLTVPPCGSYDYGVREISCEDHNLFPIPEFRAIAGCLTPLFTTVEGSGGFSLADGLLVEIAYAY